MKRLSRLRARRRPRYGIDYPLRLVRLCLAGCAAVVAGLLLPAFTLGEFQLTLIGPTLLALGCLSLALAASMLAYSLWGKFNMRRRMLGAVKWRGDETVLDIGTGTGLLAIGAAKRLRSGTVAAIDDWECAGDFANKLEKAQANIDLARVHDRVELRSDDPRDIAFVDDSFDVVLSLAFLHSIGDAARAKTCLEIARVLKPQGVAIIADTAHVKELARVFQAAGLSVEGPKSCLFEAFAAIEIVTARKPG